MSNSELLQNQDFMREQYGHLPQDEWPTSGEVVDVRGALATNLNLVTSLQNQIREKRVATVNWVETLYPGNTAVFMTRPFALRSFPDSAKEKISTWLADIIVDVYGAGYPLPNKEPEFNLHGLKSGNLLAYCGLIAPNHLGNGAIFDNPNLVHNQSLLPVASAAIVLDSNGFAELGRTARRKDYKGFDGGALVLERALDWGKNRHRLAESIHTLKSDIRAAAAHDGTPSSGPIQKLILGELDMKIYMAAPLYTVNGLEPFLAVTKPRDFVPHHQANDKKVIWTVAGDHLPLLEELWQHQLGTKPDLQLLRDGDALPYNLAIKSLNLPSMYSTLTIDSPITKNPSALTNLDESLAELEDVAPSVIIKLEAETPQSAATQKLLIDRNYTICGFEPGYNASYLDQNGSGLKTYHYTSPARIYLAKLGNRAKNGEFTVAPAYYPSNQDAGGVDLHGSKLRKLLYATDKKIRANLTP